MPTQPAWFHRLDSILAELQALEADYLGPASGRADLRCPGAPGTSADGRTSLPPNRQRRRGQPFCSSRATRRQERPVIGSSGRSNEGLGWSNRSRRSGSTPQRIGSNSLPRLMRVTASWRVCLRTSIFGLANFESGLIGPEDLAAKLFELSQAMANDWPAIESGIKVVSDSYQLSRSYYESYLSTTVVP